MFKKKTQPKAKTPSIKITTDECFRDGEIISSHFFISRVSANGQPFTLEKLSPEEFKDLVNEVYRLCPPDITMDVSVKPTPVEVALTKNRVKSIAEGMMKDLGFKK